MRPAQQLIHAARQEHEAVRRRIVVEPVIVLREAIAVAMADQYFHRQERQEAIRIQHGGELTPAHGQVRLRRSERQPSQVRTVRAACSRTAPHRARDIAARTGFRLVEVAVRPAKMLREELLGEPFLDYVQAEASPVHFHQGM